MPSEENIDRFFGAVTDAYDALLDSVKSANERGYRVSRRLIEEVERGQRDAIDLTKRLAVAPRDVTGFYSTTVRSLTDAQSRLLDLTRQFLDDLTESQREGRDTLRKVIEANRTAGQAAIDATRQVLSRAGGAVEAQVDGARGRVARTRKTAEAPEASN
jgi:hypothetical protein